MYEVGLTVYFQAAHRLKGDFGPATRLHGHTYKVEVAARGPELREDGTLCDVSKLEPPLREITGALDYNDLDDLSVFERQNTTTETLARYICDALAEQLPRRLPQSGVTALSVRIWESPFVYGSYETNINKTGE